MGVELIVFKVEVCGIQVIYKKGGVIEYMCMLMLLELRVIGQLVMFIILNIMFYIGYKVNINENGYILKG